MSRVKEIKRIDVEKIENPQFLSSLSYKELEVLCSDIRKHIIDCTSERGGHLSSNLGVVEATVALHRVFDLSIDKLIFDVGHQCYTHKILTGRNLHKLRCKDSISGFQKIDESIYDVYEAGHSSTSISAAIGFAISRDLAHEHYEVISFIGDSSISNGLAFEGLNNVNRGKHKVIIILNDNEMSISKPVGSLSNAFRKISIDRGYSRFKERTRNSLGKNKAGRWFFKVGADTKNWFKRHLVKSNIFDVLGISYIGPIDGHDLVKLEKAFNAAKRATNSVVVHINTVKGKGYEFAEKDVNGNWHGVAPFDIETGNELVNDASVVSWSKAVSSLLEEQMSKNDYLYLISPATQTGSYMSNIFKKFKSRCIDVGISEEHAVTFAGGLSCNGVHPVISMYSTFMQRSFDEISHDLARMNLDATFLVDRSGLVGSDGNTHQGVYDVSFLLGTPNVTVAMPSNINEAKTLLIESFNCHGPFFIRYPKDNLKAVDNIRCSPILYGEWPFVRKNDSKNAVIGFGPILKELDFILDKKLDVDLINAIYLKPMDLNVISKLAKKDKLFIFDAYSTEEGFITSLKAKLLDFGFKGEIFSVAIPNTFINHATIKEQLNEFGLLPEQLELAIKKFIS